MLTLIKDIKLVQQKYEQHHKILLKTGKNSKNVTVSEARSPKISK